MTKILIADDDENIASLIADSLMDEGFETEVVNDGDAVIAALNKADDYDMLILDIMMPGQDGLSVCRQVRDTIHVPIIFVTAKSRSLDVMLGLEIGADDYIKKPFIVEELTAKVKAHLRREERSTPIGRDVIKFGGLEIHKDSYEVNLNGEPVSLTTREFQLLLFLCENKGKVLTREQIFDSVWGTNYADMGSVTVTIKNLRDKIDADNKMIKTVWGVGYKFVPPEVSA